MRADDANLHSVDAVSEPPVPADAPASDAPPRRYLYGVQGLRTVAALLVAVYHIWFGRISGGVDVFFVVAGYFAVGSLFRAFSSATSAGTIALGLRNYLLRTLRRVIPSASVVIVATILLSWVWMPRSAQRSAIPFGWAATGFFENWQLIAASADYAAQDDSASPFQQFWALAVNMQFYVMFSVAMTILALILWLRYRDLTRLKKTLIGFAAVVFVGSLAFSIYLTSIDQPAAYFNTFTRLWEFMAGTLLFLLLKAEIRNKALARLLGWVGLLILLFLGAFLDLSQLFPGYLALIPVLAACGIIVASWSHADPAPLVWKPMLLIADASFALYLWHWPLLVFYRHQFGDPVSLWGGLAIIAVSVLLAVATTKLFEDPLRKAKFMVRSWPMTLAVSVVLLLIPAGLLHAWDARLDRLDVADEAALEEFISEPQSAEPEEVAPLTVDDLLPHPSVAKEDFYRPVVEDGCVQEIKGDGVLECVWGNPASDRTVVLVGGSHSQQWAESVRRAAEEVDARMVTYLKSSCLLSADVLSYFDLDQSCADWNEEVLDRILADPPTLVVTIGTRVRKGEESIPQGYRDVFEVLADHDIQVLGLRDNPASTRLMPSCLEKEGLEACALARDEVYGPIADLGLPDNRDIHILDLADTYCDADLCRAHDGIITQYRDSHHLTSTWVRFNDRIVVDSVKALLQR